MKINKIFIPIFICLCLIAYTIGYGTTTTTTNLSLVKPASEDLTVDWFDTMNDNMDLIDAIFDTVTLIEFAYLDGVTSAIQTQLNAKIEATLTEEQVEDYVGGMLGGTETNISVDYQDATNDIDFVVTLRTEEEIEDFIGGMLGGTETLITVDYQDASDDIDFVVTVPEDHITATMLIDDNSPADEDVYSYESTGPTGHWYSRAELGIGTATSITDDLILEADLNVDESPADNDILTYDTTGANFSWQTPSELITAGTAIAWDGTTLNVTLRTEAEVKDWAGGMFTGNTETLITATYQTGDDTLDLVVDSAAVTDDDTTHVPTCDGVFEFCETTKNYALNSELHTERTDLTDFVDQTAWRLFYSNTDGDVTELAFGDDGQYLMSNGAAVAPTFETPAGAGDMLKATYDADEDDEIDVAGGGTEKDSWTQYCIPYLSNTTVFGEIPIGTAEYALTVAAGATGYDFTHLQVYDAGLLSLAGLTYVSDSFIKVTATDTYAIRTIAEMKTDLSFMTDLVDDTTPELGGQLQAGAHSVNFTEQVLTPGTAVAWNLGNSNKATLTPAQNFTITITAPSGSLNAQLIITQDGTGSRVMDEIITQADATVATTDVHTDTEIVDLTVDIPTGARIRIDNQEGTDVPLPLVENTIYWAIRTSENHIQFASTKALAIAGTNVDITDTGTGTHTVEQLVKWTGGTLGVLSTVAGSEDIMSLTYKTADKQWYAVLSGDFY